MVSPITTTILKKAVAYSIILATLCWMVLNYNIEDFRVIISFVFIILFSANGIFAKNRVNYGLFQIFYLFVLFFLGIAPLFQYLEGITLWGGSPFSSIDYAKTNLLLCSALILYELIYRKVYTRSYKLCIGKGLSYSVKTECISMYLLLLTSCICSLYIFAFMYGGDIVRMLVRVDAVGDGTGNATGLIGAFFLRPIPAICFLLFKYYNKKNILAEIVLLSLMLITNAPTAIPRFAVAAFYIPLVFVYFKSIHRKYNFALFMVLALLIIFPILDIVRNENREYSLVNSFSMMLDGHFDSYQMFMRVVSTEYITYGKQLLGVIFFFIPRSIWMSKPIGSGYLIAHENNYYFDNLSMNFFGEGYINFGVVGVLIFAIVLAYYNARVDRKYWIEGYNRSPYFALFFGISIGMEFIIMRGALLNVFPAYFSYILSLKFTYELCRVRNSN